MRKRIIIVIAVVVVAVAAIKTQSWIRQQPQGEMRPDWRERGPIAWAVKKAKERGDNKVILYPPHVAYVNQIASMDEVLSYYSVVIAQPVAKFTQISKEEDRVITWYRFKILENLSDKGCDRCPPAKDISSEILPLNSDEIIVAKYGGTTSLDGVEVTMMNPSYPDYEMSEKYLLFLEVDPTRQVGRIMVGPAGVFTVKSNGDIVPVNKTDHPLKKFIKENYKSSIKELRDYIIRKDDFINAL